MAGKPLSSRKLDTLYLIFFIIHIPIMLIVDLVPLYPSSVRASLPFLTHIRSWYVATYNDQFFVRPPAWFTLYAWLELGFHLPFSIWAIPALINDHVKLPHHLLIFAVETAVTTATCVAEMLVYEGYDAGQKIKLSQLYVPYLALAIFMIVDIIQRLDVVAFEAEKVRKGTKKGAKAQ